MELSTGNPCCSPSCVKSFISIPPATLGLTSLLLCLPEKQGDIAHDTDPKIRPQTCFVKASFRAFHDTNGKISVDFDKFCISIMYIHRHSLSSSSGRCWLKQLQKYYSLNIRETYSHTSSKISGLFIPNKLLTGFFYSNCWILYNPLKNLISCQYNGFLFLNSLFIMYILFTR